MRVNFYWSGDDFQFLNRLTIISHIVVGHTPVIWLSGKRPDSIYWIDDIPEVVIKNADDIWVSSEYLKEGVDVRSTSDLWSYYLLKQTGEYIADTDAIALRPWPDRNIILATYDNKVINVGVIRLPKDHPVLDCCIDTHIKTWGNVWKFTDCCKRHGMTPTVPNRTFYPVHCGNNDSVVMRCKGKILDPPSKILSDILSMDECVSYHYWSNKVSKVGITHKWLEKPELKDSLLNTIVSMTLQNYKWGFTNDSK